MTGEQVFLLALRTDPGNVGTYRAYADWLAERGDGRAEYLRLLADLGTQDAQSAAPTLFDRLQQVRQQRGIDYRWIAALLRGHILLLIQDFQSARTHEFDRQLACLFDGLPVYSDMGGALLLRPDGEVVEVGWNGVLVRPDGGISEVVDDVRPAGEFWRSVGLAAAAAAFPVLRPLLPMRPPDAQPCPACAGVGRQPWPEGGGATWCGSCYGLGWRCQPPHAAPTAPVG
jgi:uncharacterized protein (TIGR02996 family)